jgi:hypothetical protein
VLKLGSKKTGRSRKFFSVECELGKGEQHREGTMQLRHISPGSTDWMDAMDEEGGGRGWEKLAPEERVKLLRERRDEGHEAEAEEGRGWGNEGRSSGSSGPGRGQGFVLLSPSR